MKIGIIQTRGLGDIVIAAPIAMYYIDRGCDVYWPIDLEFIDPFQYALPKISFIPVDKNLVGHNTADFFYNTPLQKLKEVGCNSILCLYSHLTGFDLGNLRIQSSLSFDAYKYAVAKVPLSEKWNLSIKRNLIREAKIFDYLGLNSTDEYILYHEDGSNFHIDLRPHITDKGVRLVKIEPITDNFLDWIGVIENCKAAYMVDSVYVNLIEQLNIKINKYLYLRSNVSFTPITKNSWQYI